VANFSICLTAQERSVIIDVLYDFVGQYSIQETVNDPESVRNDIILQNVLTKIQEEGIDCVSVDCEQIVSCIDTPNVSNAIQNIVRNLTLNDSVVINNIVNQVNSSINNVSSFYEVTNTALLPVVNPLDVNFDEQLWSGISAIVDYCNRANLDFLQTIEALTNSIELSGIIAEATPAIGDQLGSVIALADKVIEFASENYIAYETEDILTALKCRLYCEFKGQDSVSLQDIVRVIIIQGAESVLNFDFDDYQNIEEIAGIFDLIADLGTLDDEVIFWAMWMLQFSYYTFQNVFFGVSSWGALFKRFEIAMLVPSNGYLACVNCLAPPTWEQVFDFTVSASLFRRFNNDPNRAEYIAGLGWRRRLASPLNGTRLMIESVPISGVSITEIVTEFSRTIALNPNGGVFNTPMGSKGGALAIVETQTGSINVSGRILVQILNSPPNQFPSAQQLPSDLYIRKITLRGNGANPFI